MKGYYEATRKKPQTVGEFLKKTSERNYASDQIYKHNMKEGTTKLKMTGDTIYYKSGGGWTALNMLHDPIMEMNALEAIRMVTPTRSHSIYPSLAQIYTVRRADESAILQNPENLNREVFFTQDLKTKLLKYKKESVDMYEKDHHWSSDENYSAVLDKEYAEIQWLEMFRGAQTDFFNSEYVRGFGLVFQYNPPENQDQNKPLPLPQAPNHNPEPKPDEEDAEMLKELMKQLELMKQEQKQLELMKQEQMKITKALEDKDQALTLVTQERDQAITERDNAMEQVADRDRTIEDREQKLQAETDKNIDLTNKLATEKELTKGLTDKNIDLTNKLIIKDEKIGSLKEKVDDLRDLNQELKDHKESLKESNKILIEDKKIWQETEKLFKIDKEVSVNEKKYYLDKSIEQEHKISLLEQIHCNVADHEWMVVKSTGSVSVQTDEI